MIAAARTFVGILRSLGIYYGDPARRRAMDALYAGYLGGGGLAFDIGAHVGDRTGSFRRLGARVVAVEPQPALVRTLRLIHGRDPGVAIEAAAVGGRAGTIELRLNRRNPTIATASPAFVAAAAGDERWRREQWDGAVRVPLTTLDRLIERHGVPRFVKLDVEGFEAEALAGLSRPLPALSFEFTTLQRDVALACLERLGRLGRYRFQAALGESQRFEQPQPIEAEAMAAWLTALPAAANSGDIYATLA
jgi:FkbM family methyltransferase